MFIVIEQCGGEVSAVHIREYGIDARELARELKKGDVYCDVYEFDLGQVRAHKLKGW